MVGRLLDVFSGLEGWSDPFREAGWDVRTVDIDPRFNADIQVDVMDWDWREGMGSWRPDVICASPPCQTYSMMSVGKYWTKENFPRNAVALDSLELVWATRALIAEMGAPYWVIENPRAKLRKMRPVQGLDRVTVTYCRYGEPFMKPTDLWISPDLAAAWTPREMCHNGNGDHLPAPRGSKTGTQGDAILARVEGLNPELREAAAAAAETAQARGGRNHPDDIRWEQVREQGIAKARAEGRDEAWIKKNFRKGSTREVKWNLRRYYGTSIQSDLAVLRAKIPYQLADEIRQAITDDMAGGWFDHRASTTSPAEPSKNVGVGRDGDSAASGTPDRVASDVPAPTPTEASV